MYKQVLCVLKDLCTNELLVQKVASNLAALSCRARLRIMFYYIILGQTDTKNKKNVLLMSEYLQHKVT